MARIPGALGLTFGPLQSISLTSVCEYLVTLVGGSPEMGRFVGYQFQRQALTQSLSRNDTELDYRVYCGGVPRIPGMRRLVGPLRFDQSATCTWPWKRAKSSDSGLLGGMPISKTGFDLVSRPKRYQPR